jgi:hypothetical protein
MKKVIFILALIVSIGTLYAQQPGQNNKKYSVIDEKADKITNRLKADLGLTDNQSNQVKAITLNRVKQVHDAKASNAGDPKAFNQARKTIFQTWEDELKGIVTEDQYSKYLLKKDEKKKDAASKKAAKEENLEDMFSK